MKSQLFKAYFPLFVLWTIDFLIKGQVADSHLSYRSDFLHLTYVENHGIVLGGFKELPLILKTVFLSTTGIAIVASFPVLMTIVRLRSLSTVLGLSFIYSGILGNVTDRVLYGFVIDYIYFQTPYFSTPVFNLADFVQWIGYLLFFHGVFREVNHHFPENDKRNSGWINPPYQLKFSAMLSLIILSLGVTFIMFSYTFLKFGLLEFSANPIKIEQYLNYFLITASILLAFSALMVFLLGKIISHRIAGPMYAIRNFVNDTLAGKKRELFLREQDHLKDLEGPLTLLNKEHIALRSPEDDEIPEIPEEAKKAA